MAIEIDMYQYKIYYPYAALWTERKNELAQKYGRSGYLMPEESGVVNGEVLELFICKPGIQEEPFIVPSGFWDYIE